MPSKRKKHLFDPTAAEPFAVSRSGVEEWLSCRRCFYLHRCLGIAQPGLPSMMLNRAVDVLLKSEFDQFRAQVKPHPLMERHGINAIPFSHPDLAAWRSNFKGIRLLHTPSPARTKN